MKRKLLTTFIAAITVTACAFGFTACNVSKLPTPQQKTAMTEDEWRTSFDNLYAVKNYTMKCATKRGIDTKIITWEEYESIAFDKPQLENTYNFSTSKVDLNKGIGITEFGTKNEGENYGGWTAIKGLISYENELYTFLKNEEKYDYIEHVPFDYLEYDYGATTITSNVIQFTLKSLNELYSQFTYDDKADEYNAFLTSDTNDFPSEMDLTLKFSNGILCELRYDMLQVSPNAIYDKGVELGVLHILYFSEIYDVGTTTVTTESEIQKIYDAIDNLK